MSDISFGKSCTLYFDGSHNNKAKKAGAGCFIEDNQGKFVIAAAYNITESFRDYCDVAIVEADALRNGLKLAKDNNVNLSLIKGDNKEVIDRVLGYRRKPPRPALRVIIKEIKGMISFFKRLSVIINRVSTEIVHISREDNKAADKLAFYGSNWLPSGGKIFRTYADLPPQVAEVVKLNTEVVGIKSTARTHYQINRREKNHPKNSERKKDSLCISILRCGSHVKSRTLYFDGSHDNQANKAGAGCIIKDNRGELDVAAAYNITESFPDYCDVAIAETVALRNGLKLAKDSDVNLSPIKGHSKEVSELVKPEMLSRSSSKEEEEDEGEGSGLAGDRGFAGVVVAGLAMLAFWGVSKLFGESSSDQQERDIMWWSP